MCLYPKLIKNKKYIPNKKNGGIIPPVNDERVLMVPVGCGKCIECMKQKSREWQVRMLEDIKVHQNGKFVTLTFNEESLEKLQKETEIYNCKYTKDNAVATLAVRRFLERWRKEHKKSVRHWLVTELGHKGTERIHIHGIIYTDNASEIDKHWTYGFTGIGKYVNERTINYIVKYIHKIDEKHKNYKPKILCSKGIGRNYLEREDSKHNKFKEEKTKEYYRARNGSKIALPIYYRNNIYDDDEREKLWLNKLNKQERWVCGEKIDISENEEEYEKVREHYRGLNTRLGYGDDSVNWDEKLYKNQRKKLQFSQKKLKSEKKVAKNLENKKEISNFSAAKTEREIFNKANKVWEQ